MKNQYALKGFLLGILTLVFSFSSTAQIVRPGVNVNLSAPADGDRVSGTFTVSATANDERVGDNNGDGIRRILFQIRDGRTNQVLDSQLFRGRNLRPPFQTSFDSREYTRTFSRDVLLRVQVIGSRNGRRSPQVVTITRRFVVDNTPTPSPDFETPETIEEELNRLDVTFSVPEGATISDTFSGEITAVDPARGSNNGEGIGRISFALLDAETREGLFGTNFNRGGGLGGFSFLLPPPYIVEYDTERITRPSQPIREVILQVRVSGFTQNSQVDPSQRITPVTIIERRVTVDNTDTFGGEPDVNIPQGFAPDIGGVFTFEVTGSNIASVDFEVESQLPGLFRTGRDTTAPFTFTVDFNNIDPDLERGFFDAIVTLTDGTRQRISRRFTIDNPSTGLKVAPTETPFIKVSEGVLEIQSNNPINVITVVSMTGKIIMKKQWQSDEQSKTVRMDLPSLSSGLYIINVNGESYRAMIQ